MYMYYLEDDFNKNRVYAHFISILLSFLSLISIFSIPSF